MWLENILERAIRIEMELLSIKIESTRIFPKEKKKIKTSRRSNDPINFQNLFTQLSRTISLSLVEA